MINKLNLFFFGEQDIHRSDKIWFYGTYGFALFTVALAIFCMLTL